MSWFWLLPLLLLLSSQVSHGANDNLIVPGYRVGPWTLAMTLVELISMNGPPDSQGRALTGWSGTANSDKKRYLDDAAWDQLGLSAAAFDGEKVLYLRVRYHPSRRYATSQGIGYGASRQEMEKAHSIASQIVYYPPRFQWRREIHVYDLVGLAFWFTRCVNDLRSAPCIGDPDGTFQVTGADVFRPGDAKRIWGDWLRPNR